MVAQSLTRPYPVSIWMVLLVSLVPFYIFIAEATVERAHHVPEIALDRAIPLVAAWALVYGALYLFLIALPVFVVRQQDHIRRTVFAYLSIWITAYVCFLLYPTMASRPAHVSGSGFTAWGLRFLYDADPPFNCFPSLHVAHSFVSALTAYRVNRRLGIASLVCATLVGVSTLYTKQHYIADVIAGILLACIAYTIFLRNVRVPDMDRRLAPMLALAVAGVVAIAFAGYVAMYLFLYST